MLTSVAASCAYLAVPLTVGLASAHVPSITLISLVCLSAPALPVWWWSAVPLGVRRRETALALRQVRLRTRTAALTSVSRLLTYPVLGSALGAALISGLHGSLARILPQGAPLTQAIKASSGHWLLAAPASIVLLTALTAALGTTRSAAAYARIAKLLERPEDRREAAPQPQ